MSHVQSLHYAFTLHAKNIKQHWKKHWRNHLTPRCVDIWATLIIVGTVNVWLMSKSHPLRKLHSSAESQDSYAWRAKDWVLSVLLFRESFDERVFQGSRINCQLPFKEIRLPNERSQESVARGEFGSWPFNPQLGGGGFQVLGDVA